MRRYRGPERFPGRICSFGAPAVTGDSPAAVRSARSSIVPTSVTARLSGVNSLSNGRKLPNGQSGDIRRGDGGTMALVRRLRLGARLGASFAVVLVLLGVVVAIGAEEMGASISEISPNAAAAAGVAAGAVTAARSASDHLFLSCRWD
jgi:hypothetical protein